MTAQCPRRTVFGNVIDILDVKVNDVKAWDIAWSLSGISRYYGATAPHWSVLSHTSLCLKIAEHEKPGSVSSNLSMGLALLLHDASEAYAGDMHAYLKAQPAMQWYRDLHHRITVTIFKRFSLDTQAVDWEFVNYVDKAAASYEMIYFFGIKLADVPKETTTYNTPLVAVEPVHFISSLKEYARTAIDKEGLYEVPDRVVALYEDYKKRVPTAARALEDSTLEMVDDLKINDSLF